MNRKTNLLAMVSMILMLLPLAKANAQDVTLDDAFSPNLNGNVFSMLPLEKSKMLVGGSITGQGAYNDRNGLVLMDYNGTQDDDFGFSATFTEASSTSGSVYHLAEQEVWGEKRIIVVGSFLKWNDTDKPYILRLTTNGSLDWGFNPAKVDGSILKAFVRSDGKIWIVGNFVHADDQTVNGIALLNEDGSLDTDYNQGQVGIKNFSETSIQSAALAPNDQLIVVGALLRYNGVGVRRVARINADGSLDTSFVGSSSSIDWVRTVWVQDDGKIMLGGDFQAFNGNSDYRYIVRLNSDGSLDETFKFTSIAPNDDVSNSVLQIVPFQDKYYVGIDRSIALSVGTLFRLNADGSLDDSFLTAAQHPDNTVTYINITKKGDLYVSGLFKNIMGQARNYFARLKLDVPNVVTDDDIQEQGYKIISRFDFEDQDYTDYGTHEFTVNGIRWRVVNGKIETDVNRNVPQGTHALSLKALSGSEPACLEMLDDFTAATGGVPEAISLRTSLSGQDGNIHDGGWMIAVSYDQGATWAYNEFTAPTTPEAYYLDFPEQWDPQSSVRVKIYYAGKPQGQRLLLDDIVLFEKNQWGFHIPTMFGFKGMHEGYKTAKTTFPVKLRMTSLRGITDPDFPYDDGMGTFDSYVQINLDGEKYVDLSRVTIEDSFGDEPIEPDFTLENLTPGMHTLEAKLMKLDRTEWGPNPESFKINFEVVPEDQITAVKGLKQLRNQPVGGFYEVTPESDNAADNMIVNLYVENRNQKYLKDKSTGMLIDDPQDNNKVKSLIPSKLQRVTKMRGQLVKLDDILTFRTDEEMTLEDTPNEFVFQLDSYSTLQSIVNNADNNESMLCILQNVTFDAQDQESEIIAGESYKLHDATAASIDAYILNVKRLLLNIDNPTIPSNAVDMLAIVSKNYETGELALVPILWVPSQTDAVNDLADNNTINVTMVGEGNIAMTAPGQCQVRVFTLAGAQVASIQFTTSGQMHLDAGEYVVVLQSGSQMRAVKCVVR